jgi:acetoin utilization deacetylase AcuC-like enzyme
MLAFSSSPHFIDHLTGPNHPERPDRIRAIARAVREAGIITSPDPFPNFAIDLGELPRAKSPAIELTPKPADEKWLLTIHTPEHIERIRHICQLGGGILDTADTPVGHDSFDIALLSLGSLLGCCDTVMTGQATRAFSAARPPGHHAEPQAPMGFCLFANVAIATKYLQQKYSLTRIAIVDFDVHHGNGTQACLENDPHKLFISIHQHPRTCYPGSGYEYETGLAPAEGLTVNVPLQPGSDDLTYRAAFEEIVIPKLNAYRPEILLISAGFDAHADDPLANMEVSEEGFAMMTKMLVEIANTHCAGRIVSALEGGYNLRALGRSVVRHLIALSEDL